MTGAELRLYVNIDHVATLREARKTDEPDPVEAARCCEDAGADGITVHLREDRRHIQDRDVEQLRRNVRTVLNLELATSEDVVAFACRIHPYQATLVPERREEVTTEGGLDLQRSGERLRETIDRLRQIGARVSLFIDPEPAAIEAAAALDVPAVELHTGRYAHSWRQSDRALEELAAAARRARSLGLAVHAGHGLTYLNVEPVAQILEIEELNIGHSIMSRAILTGMSEAVTTMGRLVRGARRSATGAP
ncbi:MAG TPA: pyridoxine 5'-phosphate synthase [Gemmatimonadales bacterium]|jgi:pyridoxine 5-phosphate synthase|nr:pyridoxine 5'-phosphate synthase [Gemmatimonadales bacterium]